MKKNLLSILILALVIVNMVLTGIMMFSVTNTNQKTAQLVTNIAAALNLNLTMPGEEETTVEVSMADTAEYSLGSMTIPLARETAVGADGQSSSANSKQTYIIFNISLVMNTKSDGYSTYGTAEALAERTNIIKDSISEVIGSHTENDCRDNFEEVRAEILLALQNLFQSDFIYRIAISDIMYG